MKKIRVTAVSPAAGIKAQLTLVLVAILTVYYRQPLPFLLLILLLLYLAWSYAWTLASCRFARVESKFRLEKIFCGDSLKWCINLYNEMPFPLARCGVRFFLPAELSCRGNISQENYHYMPEATMNTSFYLLQSWQLFSTSYAWIPGKKGITINIDVTATQRGIYYLPPARYFAGDPSGLFQGRFQGEKEKKLVVFPRTRSFGDLQAALFLEESSKKKGSGLEDRYEYQGVRDYQLNDPPKNINWYASARTGSLKSNLYQPRVSQRCLVVFDMSAAGHPVYEEQAGRLSDPPLEEAISTAAGIALFYLEQDVMTAFVTNAPLLGWEKKKKAREEEPGVLLQRRREVTAVPYSTGMGHAQKILEACAAIDETSRARLVDQVKLWDKAKVFSADALVYLVCYHQAPHRWERLPEEERKKDECEPISFYTSRRLEELSSSRVRLLNLTGGES